MKSKTKKNNSINISVFGYENKAKCPIHTSKNAVKKKIRYYVIIKDSRSYEIVFSVLFACNSAFSTFSFDKTRFLSVF